MPLVVGAEVRLRSIDMLSTKMYKTPMANTLLMLLSRPSSVRAVRRVDSEARRAGAGTGVAVS